MRIHAKNKVSAALLTLSLFSSLFLCKSVQALELNWSGQFWSEWHYIKNYTLDASGNATLDPTRASAANGGSLANPGYYVPPGGSSNASFETLFLRLRPKLVVNDNVSVKAELWAGDPVFGLFGNAVPYTLDQRQYYSSQSRGSALTAQRYWVELLSDFGTVQVGRAPLDWGLGMVWNSGEELWSRYASTGDVVRLVSKFGSFSLSPGVVIYSMGNNVGGSCAMDTVAGVSVCKAGNGNGGIADYSLALKYENLEDELEGGVNFIKRLSGPVQDGTALSMGSSAQTNYNVWDIYARKKVGKFVLSGELPILSGSVAGIDYSGFALAGDVNWKMNDAWESQLRVGRAPGQPNGPSTVLESYRAFSFHPNYHLGMIMFNYQLANFAGPNTTNNSSTSSLVLRSPYDNPITNATYLAFTETFKTQKWTFNAGLVYARAMETAAGNSYFYNSWQKKWVQKDAAARDQDSSLGLEMDLGASLQWDDHFTLRVDTGLWMPGDFYKFSNTAKENATDAVWATSAKVGVSF